MKQHAEKLQMVKNTLEALQLPATQRNSNALAGIYAFLDEAIKFLLDQEEKKEDEEPALSEGDV